MEAMAPHVVLGHQGGWDEMLLVAGPLAVIAVLLWLANRRVQHQLQEQGTPVDVDDE